MLVGGGREQNAGPKIDYSTWLARQIGSSVRLVTAGPGDGLATTVSEFLETQERFLAPLANRTG